MNMQTKISVAADYRSELWRHAGIARDLGSPFVAAVLEAGDRQLDRAPLTSALIRNWPGNASHDAVAMRFNAALHDIARAGINPRLSTLYGRLDGDFDGAIGEVLVTHDQQIAKAMRDTPQTNEVGRSGAIAAALMVARRALGLPFELLELGASCGLNLNLGHYGFKLGPTEAGVRASPVQVAPAWIGRPPDPEPIEIVGARGVDLHPLQAGDAETRNRLLSYIWADQPHRARRLEQALALAQLYPPCVDQGDAVPWLDAQLDTAQPQGVCRVVYHSMFLQYLNPLSRNALATRINQAGALATRQRPFAWISFERTRLHYEVQLRLTCWPNGTSQLLATCHAYGNWIDWVA